MEEAVAEHLAEEGFGRFLQQRINNVPGGHERGAVVDADAIDDSVDGQDDARSALPIDARHAKAAIAGEILGEFRGGGRLEPQVDLDLDRFFERARDLNRLQPAQRRAGLLDQPAKPQQQVEVTSESGGDPRAQDLDRDLPALTGDREMHLGDRGGSDRHILEGNEHRIERAAEFGFDARAGLACRKRRQPILQHGQIGGDVVTEQVGARRQHLAELYESGANLLECRSEALPRARPGAAPPYQACQT